MANDRRNGWVKYSFTEYISGKIFPLFIILSLCFGTDSTFAQIVRLGIKAGAQLNWTSLDSPEFKDTVSVSPALGFQVGAVVSFKVKDRYFLQTEYLYSQKGKVMKGKIDPNLHDEVTYRYIEVPILYTMHFKAQLSGDRSFKWYLGAGPNVSYWLGGSGTMTSSDLLENGLDKLDYTIAFGERPEGTYDGKVIYYPKANRFQFGLNIGAGLLFEPDDRHKIMVDLRYEIDNTRLAKRTADYQIPADYDDNIRARNRGFKVSVAYLVEYNLDKKVRNKGKTDIHPK